MHWTALLSHRRHGDRDPARPDDPNRPSYAMDYDRVLFSHPFKRLAHKTQVHPLSDHDHLHNRQIHSAETASVGRSLGMEIGAWLEETGEIAPAERHRIAGVLQAACLAHDLGNPPFGHSGEKAIGAWFAALYDAGRSPLIAEGPPAHLRAELEAFEGNAQGFRILTRTEMYRNEGGMRPSFAVLGAFSKYPTVAALRAAGKPYVGAKKFGFFASEAAFYEEAAAAMEIPRLPIPGAPDAPIWRRHPLVWLVEAADDLCYRILDVEDAHFSGDLTVAEIVEKLGAVAQTDAAKLGGMNDVEKIAYLRARGIGAAIQSCAGAFRDNYAAIMAGEDMKDLAALSSLAEPLGALKDISAERIIAGSMRKAQLETSGRNTIHAVLDGILPVFETLARNGWDRDALDDYQAQLTRAIDLDIRDAASPETALRAMADYVSGMTDRFALRTARILSGL